MKFEVVFTDEIVLSDSDFSFLTVLLSDEGDKKYIEGKYIEEEMKCYIQNS